MCLERVRKFGRHWLRLCFCICEVSTGKASGTQNRLPSRLGITRRMALGAILVATSVAIGCDQDRVERFDLTGAVTFRGQPVPKGYLIFQPDSAQGNRGPGSKAGLFSGRYETMEGQGTVGGPHIVSIVGTDGVPFDQGGGVMNPMGRPLFPDYKVHVDLPKESGTFDFEVPAGQAK